MTISNVLAVGAGTMGGQVGLYYAMYGYNVTQFDISEEALASCKQRHRDYLDSFRRFRPHFADGDIEAGLARISYSSDLAEAGKNADLVTESAPEVLAIKQQLFADLNRICPEHTIFTTNTSTLLPSAMAEATGRPERFMALHYLIPMWEVPIGEMMRHPGTDDAVFEEVGELVEKIELVPIRVVKEQPGYVINSMFVPWVLSALALVANGVCSYREVDRTWLICGRGMTVGPLGLLDQTGFEVCCNVLRTLAAAEPNNPQHQISLDYLEENYINKGHLGVLTGQGFYSYPNPEYLQADFLR